MEDFLVSFILAAAEQSNLPKELKVHAKKVRIRFLEAKVDRLIKFFIRAEEEARAKEEFISQASSP